MMQKDDREPYGGRAPFRAESDTSEAAAEEIEPVKLRRRQQVYEYIIEHDGATILEIVEGSGLAYGTVCGRQGELRELGLIKDTGRRRKNSTGAMATVWMPGDGIPLPRSRRLDEAQALVRELEAENARLRRELADLRAELDKMKGGQLGLPWR